MNIIQKLAFALTSLTLSLTACTNTISHSIDSNGHIEPSNIFFPKLDKAWQKDGQFPNSENLSKIKPGIGKDELYQLIGRPHFSEAQHAHEWDYIMKFYQPDSSVKICQYKVIFDKDYKGQEFYWHPEDCAALANAEPAQPAVVVAPMATPVASVVEKINLSADALFRFDKWRPEDMLAAGYLELDNLAEKLMAYQSKGATQIMITGHTDYLGEDMYNMNLSLLRAQTVRSYLINKGIDANSLIATGAGESQPVKQCNSSLSRADLINCLQPNRRVEVSVVSIYK